MRLVAKRTTGAFLAKTFLVRKTTEAKRQHAIQAQIVGTTMSERVLGNLSTAILMIDNTMTILFANKRGKSSRINDKMMSHCLDSIWATVTSQQLSSSRQSNPIRFTQDVKWLFNASKTRGNYHR